MKFSHLSILLVSNFLAQLTVSLPVIAAEQTPWAEETSQIQVDSPMPKGVLEKQALDALIKTGEALFSARFTKADGAGRPNATQAIIPTKARSIAPNGFARTSGPEATSCASCHNEPIVGGAGDFVTNVFVSEGFNNADFDSVDPQFSNERGTNHLFGAGLVELLAREMTTDLASIRSDALKRARESGEKVTVDLVTKGVSFGKLSAMPDGIVDLAKIEGIDTDLVIRPFSQKGVMTSLRQFTINALNQHHGMQAVERFGARWTGENDFDEDGYPNEMGESDIAALVAWQASLPAPVQNIPDNQDWREAAKIGEENFSKMGCSACHIKSLPLNSISFADPGPVDIAGTLNTKSVGQPAIYDLALLEWTSKLARNDAGQILVPLFGDLKRHVMTDKRNNQLGNELLSQRFVDRTIFMTSELWGVGSTAPYGHRNDFTTLDEIIRAHGGDAAEASKLYKDADEAARSSIIAFLKTLVIRP